MSNTKPEDFINRQYLDLVTHKNALQHAVFDTKAADSGTTVIYLSDFNVLYPYMWHHHNSYQKNRPRSEKYYDVVGSQIYNLYSSYKGVAGHRIVISDPTLIEILDSLIHKYNDASSVVTNTRIASQLRARLKFQLDNLDKAILLKSRDVREVILSITEHLPNGSIREANTRLASMLDNGTISLVSDFIDDNSVKKVLNDSADEYASIVNKMRQRKSLTETREFDHSMLHYKIDAWSLILAKTLPRARNDLLTTFMCKSEMRHMCDDPNSSQYIRSPLASFVKLASLYRASKDGNIRQESNDWLREAIDTVKSRIHALEDSRKKGNLSITVAEGIEHFYNRYIRQYLTVNEDAMAVEAERDRIQQIIKDGDAFMGHFEKAAQDAKDGAKAIVERRPLLMEGELLETYDLEDDPYFRREFQKLGLL